MNHENPDATLVETDTSPIAPVAFIKFTASNCILVDKDKETLDRHAEILKLR
jgi:hypothetical protein